MTDISPALIAVVDDDQRILESDAARAFPSGSALLESGCVAEIDCLISDLCMPGMDGFELARTLRVARSNLPVIFITAHADLADHPPVVGLDDYVLFRKPFDGEDLLSVIRDMLQTPR
jgi:FixJ family two-component response regulator